MEITDSLNIDVKGDESDSPQFICPICMVEVSTEEKCITECNHPFCKDCIHSWLNQNKVSCPSCRGEIKYYMNNLEKNNIIRILIPTRNQESTGTIEITTLRNRIYYFYFLLCINFLYTVYTITNDISLNNQIVTYKSQLSNCTSMLAEMNKKYNVITNVLILFQQTLINCNIPKYFIDQCTAYKF
jgi:hypothetical protein